MSCRLGNILPGAISGLFLVVRGSECLPNHAHIEAGALGGRSFGSPLQPAAQPSSAEPKPKVGACVGQACKSGSNKAWAGATQSQPSTRHAVLVMRVGTPIRAPASVTQSPFGPLFRQVSFESKTHLLEIHRLYSKNVRSLP